MILLFFFLFLYSAVAGISQAASVCSYKISELNCKSDFDPLISWSNGQHYAFVELEARCGFTSPLNGHSHNLDGFSLVFWNFTTACSNLVVPLDTSGSISGGQYLSIALEENSMLHADIKPKLYKPKWLPETGYAGAVSLHRRTPFPPCPSGAPFQVAMDLSSIERGMTDYLPFSCGLTEQYDKAHMFNDVTRGKLDLSISRKYSYGKRSYFSLSIPTPGTINIQLSSIQKCYGETGLHPACRVEGHRNYSTGTATKPQRQIAAWNAQKSSESFIVKNNTQTLCRRVRRPRAREPMLVDDTERPFDYGDRDEDEPPACKEDGSPQIELSNGLPETEVEDTRESEVDGGLNHPSSSQESETTESDDVSDLSSCLHKDYKEASPQCFTKMLTRGTFLPRGYNAWVTRPNQNRDKKRKIPGTQIPYDWFKDYPFLGYSEKLKQLYCQPCAMGCSKGLRWDTRTSPQLITEPLKINGGAAQTLFRHGSKPYHTVGITNCKKFERDPEDLAAPLPDPEEPEPFEPERYRILLTGLTSIVKVVLLLARQGLAFLGHQTSVFTVDEQTPNMFDSIDWQYSNFEGLARFRMESGDHGLLEHLMKSGGRSKYVHHEVQNKILQLAGEEMQKQILDEVRASLYFSIIADGTTDVAQRDQLTIVLRYLKNNRIKEAFVAFRDVSSSAKGKHIFDVLTKFFDDHRLDMNRCRGQGYDAGSNMAGIIIGVQKMFQNLFHKAALRALLCT